jgi:hypothetical protein
MEELPHIQSIDDVLTHPQLLAGTLGVDTMDQGLTGVFLAV